MRIGIVVGSIRDGRRGRAVGEWVMAETIKLSAEQQDAVDQQDVEWVMVDLKEFDVPLLTSDTVPMAANGDYESAEVTAWAKAIDECDGFIFVTAEYNHSVPGAFKNAVDCLGSELIGKTVGFVSYGGDGGVRAVEHWRQIVANFQMYAIRPQVSLGLFHDFDGDELTPTERRPAELATVCDKLIELTKSLRQ